MSTKLTIPQKAYWTYLMLQRRKERRKLIENSLLKTNDKICKGEIINDR